jgi:hypothetical protein
MRLKLGLAAFAVAIAVLTLAPAVGSASEQMPAVSNGAGDTCEISAVENASGVDGAVQEAKCCKMCGDNCLKLDKRCYAKSGCACSPLAQEPPDEAI